MDSVSSHLSHHLCTTNELKSECWQDKRGSELRWLAAHCYNLSSLSRGLMNYVITINYMFLEAVILLKMATIFLTLASKLLFSASLLC